MTNRTVPLDLLVRVRDSIDTMGRYSDGRMKENVRPLLAELTAQIEQQPPEDIAEHFIQAEIDRAPESLRRLGEYLANVLDEDQWKTAQRMLLGGIEQQRERLPHNLDNLSNVLIGCAGLLDNIKIEWSAEGCWSEWDQSVRDGVTRQLQKLEQQREGQGEPVAWNLICEGSPPYDRVRWANGEEICAIPGREFHDQISALVDAHNGMDNKEHAPRATPQDSVPAVAIEFVRAKDTHEAITKAVIDGLYYFDNRREIEAIGTYDGTLKAVAKGIQRYREDAEFHAKVDAMAYGVRRELESRALALAQTKRNT